MPKNIVIVDPFTGQQHVAPAGTPIPEGFKFIGTEEGGVVTPGDEPQTGMMTPFEGLDPVELLTSVATGGAGALGGKMGVKALRTASRMRPLNVGRLGDIRRMAKATREVGTALQPSGTGESLQAFLKGVKGAAAMSGQREAQEQALMSMTPRPRRLSELMTELADAGKRAFTPGGEVRGTQTALQPLRDRAQILADIKTELQGLPGAQEAFDTMQRQFAQGSELQRLFRSPGVFGGTGGFDQGALQAAFQKRQRLAENILPPEFTRRLMRGFTSKGVTPRTDVAVGGPLISVRTGGGRLADRAPTIGRLLSAPNTPLMQGLTSREIEHLMTILGAGKGATLGPGLAEFLRQE